MANTRKGLRKYATRLASHCVKGWKFLATGKLVQYFLYSGITYIALGVVAWVGWPQVKLYLCRIPANEKEGGEGCEWCWDKLMMCEKDLCWRLAVNLTYLKNSQLPNNLYYTERRAAALDSSCNGLIVTANSPFEMLDAITRRRQRSNGAEPSAACVTFHCQVFLNAVLEKENKDLPLVRAVGSTTHDCENKYQMKDPAKAKECPCASEITKVSLESLDSIVGLCGSMAQSLTDPQVYEQILLESKDLCFSHALQKELQRLRDAEDPTAAVMKTNQNCSYLTQQAGTTFDWFQVKEEEEQLYQDGKTPYRFNVPPECNAIMCTAFNTTLSDTSRCDWKSMPLVGLTEEDAQRMYANCQGFEWPQQSLCNIIGLGSEGPVLCQNGAVTATFTTTVTQLGASARRMGRAHRPVVAPTNFTARLQAGKARRQHAAASISTRRRVQATPHPGVECHDTHGGASYCVAGAGPALHWGNRSGNAGRWAARSDAAPDPRLLQDSPSPTPATTIADSDLADWDVSPWSDCTCLQQCIEGVRTRSVSCPPDTLCKQLKPEDAEACTCWHCANCYVVYMIQIIAIAYWFQGGVCMLLCVSFYFVTSLHEDDLSEVRIPMKLLGCFCKLMPTVIRIVVYLLMFGILSIVFQVLPFNPLMEDCHGSIDLRILTIVISSVWAVQLALGIKMRRRMQMPPWLHTAVKSGSLKLAMAPFRSIGP